MFGAGDVIAGIRAGGRGPAGIGAGTLGVAVSGGAGLLAGTAGHIALRQGRTWDIAGTIVAGRRRVTCGQRLGNGRTPTSGAGTVLPSYRKRIGTVKSNVGPGRFAGGGGNGATR